MWSTILTLILMTSPVEFGTGKPTADEVERAHQLLNGTWELVSLTDDGDQFGKELIREKMAENGRLVVAGRSFQIVNPETGEKRVTPFRVNPSTQPRQIDLTSKNDQILGGIYKFEGDELVVCIDQLPDGGHPSSFDAPAGSNRMLVRLRTVPKVTPVATEIKDTTAPTSPAIPVSVIESRRPSESEITRVRELLSGNWDILSIDDDGEKLGPELIRLRFAENGRIRFGTRALAIINPKTEERTVNSYRVDPSKNPSQIDLTTQFDTVQKGIYLFEGDKLQICIAKHEDSPRPTEFKAPGGSDRMLFQLKVAKPDPVVPAVVTVSAPSVPIEPTADELARRKEAKIRRMIEGSWVMSDSKGTLTTVFQPDGMYVATRTWSKSAKRLFGPPTDSSQGSWVFDNSVLSAYVSTTTDARIVGHQIRARVQSIGEDTMVVSDAFGGVKTFRRLH